MSIHRQWVPPQTDHPKDKGRWLYEPGEQLAAEALMIYGLNLADFDDWLETNDEDIRDGLIHWRGRAIAAFRDRNIEALEAWALFLNTAMRGAKWTDFMRPLAKHGRDMRRGRKKGTEGPIRKFVRAHLMKDTDAKPAAIWAALKKKPPKGVEVYESGPKDRWHICTDKGKPTSYSSFSTTVSSERKALKPSE